jgi:hypothetical protein
VTEISNFWDDGQNIAELYRDKMAVEQTMTELKIKLKNKSVEALQREEMLKAEMARLQQECNSYKTKYERFAQQPMELDHQLQLATRLISDLQSLRHVLNDGKAHTNAVQVYHNEDWGFSLGSLFGPLTYGAMGLLLCVLLRYLLYCF